MTANVLTFASAKGGSGKTTLTATLGTFLAELNYTVLLVDCDEATNGLTLLYIDAVNGYPALTQEDKSSFRGVFDEYDDKTQTANIVEIGERLHLIPAAFMFERQKPFTDERFHARVRAIITERSSEFDFIILDAQAGADPISLVAMDRGVSSLVVVVSEYDPLSAAGVERLKGIAGESLSFDRTWVLLNKMLPEFISSFSEFLSVSHYLPPIPWTADVVRAYARRALALDFEIGNEFTLAVLQTVKALPIPGLKEKTDRWMETKASVIRQPVETQYSDLEDMLKAVSMQIRELSQSRLRRRAYIRSMSGTILAILLSVVFYIGVMRFNIFSTGTSWSVGELALLLVASVGLVAASATAAAWIADQVDRLFGLARGDVGIEIEIDRLERQRTFYQDKLQELEFLRSADPATVLESRFNS